MNKGSMQAISVLVKRCCYTICLMLMAIPYAHSEEGMWLLPLLEELNMDDMLELGLELDADQIYSINQSSLKDAVVLFDGGCTGEIVSPEGLLFTNYHCGYGQVQQHSSIENNYLLEGFWATTRKEELPNPGLKVHFLKRIEDVTDRIHNELSDTLTAKDRKDRISAITEEIENKAEEDSLYEARVKSNFAGNSYFLFVYRVYSDVRLVGAPPSSIGKFGSDTDNWEWPRHTGDFSIFRVYTAPDGSPADYSEDNVPLQTDAYLKISLNGIEGDDFTMVMGYPGNTMRYKTSHEIYETMNVANANRIKIRGVRRKVLKEAMEANPEVAIKYASKYASSSNYWKYSVGQNKGLQKSGLIEQRRAHEADFINWVEADSVRSEEYGMVLSNIEEIYKNKLDAERNFRIISEALFKACELIDFMSDFSYLNVLLQSGIDRSTEIQEETEELIEETELFFRNYSLPTDKKVCKAMMKLYFGLVDESDYPLELQKGKRRYRGNIDRMVDKLFSKTFFTDKEEVLNFLKEPNPEKLQRDYGFKVAQSVYRKFIREYSTLKKNNAELSYNEYRYLKGSMEKEPNDFLYPDANLTMRLSYGTVEPYQSGNAVNYGAHTYLNGVIEKQDTIMAQYTVDSKLKKLYDLKDYGNYDDEGAMPVCFITNNDITGGNSGSPVLNSKGELVGLAFDSNWEALTSDFKYEPELQRCICVDIRYVLFIIDKFAGASHIINELELLN